MKILIISHFVPFPPQGGALQRNYNLVKGISQNHEIHMITLTQKALLPTEERLKQSINVVKKYCKSIKVFGIPTDKNRIFWFLLLLFNLFSTLPYSVWRYRSKAMIKEVRNHLRNAKYDIIHVDTIDLAQYVKYNSSLPKVLNHHNIESGILLRRAAKEKNLLAKTYLYLQGWKLRHYEKRKLAKFNLNLTVSELDGILLQKICPDADFTVISNGVDTDYFKPFSTEPKDDNIVFVASLNWYPNLDAVNYLINEIWPLLKNKIPDIIMNLVGGPPPKNVAAFGLADRSFKVHGFVEDVRPYMAESAVYIVPIRIGGGTRLKILDAMAIGKAVVSTSIGCEGLNVTDGKDILIADNPADFVDKIIDVLGNPGLRRRLESNARKTAENYYSWNKIVPKLENAYFTAIEKNKLDRR